jgi:hypothetical protein
MALAGVMEIVPAHLKSVLGWTRPSVLLMEGRGMNKSVHLIKASRISWKRRGKSTRGEHSTCVPCNGAAAEETMDALTLSDWLAIHRVS